MEAYELHQIIWYENKDLIGVRLHSLYYVNASQIMGCPEYLSVLACHIRK